MIARIEVRGSKELERYLKTASAEVREEVGNQVTTTALRLQKDAKRRVKKKPASGRVYEKYNPRRTHQASAPGEAPMSDTGRLANSIVFDTVGPLTATVGARAVYAAWLEYGTRKMAPRPFMRPAAEVQRARFQDDIEAAIRRATK